MILFFGEAIGHVVGLLVFSLLTLGQVQVKYSEEPGLVFPWHGFARNSRNKVVVKEDMAAVIGIWVFVVALILFFILRGNVPGR